MRMHRRGVWLLVILAGIGWSVFGLVQAQGAEQDQENLPAIPGMEAGAEGKLKEIEVIHGDEPEDLNLIGIVSLGTTALCAPSYQRIGQPIDNHVDMIVDAMLRPGNLN